MSNRTPRGKGAIISIALIRSAEADHEAHPPIPSVHLSFYNAINEFKQSRAEQRQNRQCSEGDHIKVISQGYYETNSSSCLEA